MDCLFCKIIKGEIPCYKIYEDENVLAFLDISKEGYGHTLVVPKQHSKNFVETEIDVLNKVMAAAQKIIKHYTDNCGFSGANIVINNGESAGQSIHHLHVHIIPRREGDYKDVFNFPVDKVDLTEVRKALEVKK